MSSLVEPLQALLDKMQVLYEERDWSQFHSPKNLTMDLASEVGELIDHFRFLTESESHIPPTLPEIRQEIGDCFIVLLHLAARLGIDPIQAAHDKLDLINERYPAALSKGSAAKYTTYS